MSRQSPGIGAQLFGVRPFIGGRGIVRAWCVVFVVLVFAIGVVHLLDGAPHTGLQVVAISALWALLLTAYGHARATTRR